MCITTGNVSNTNQIHENHACICSVAELLLSETTACFAGNTNCWSAKPLLDGLLFNTISYQLNHEI